MPSRAARVAGQTLLIVAIGSGAAFLHASIKPITIHTDSQPSDGSRPESGGDPRVKTVTLGEARILYDDGQVAFIDARERDLYEASHVPGAFWLPFSVFMAGKENAVIDFLPHDQPIVIYCEGGDCHASHQVAEMLLDYGFTDLRVLGEGWPVWDSGGHPVEKGPPAIEIQ